MKLDQALTLAAVLAALYALWTLSRRAAPGVARTYYADREGADWWA